MTRCEIIKIVLFSKSTPNDRKPQNCAILHSESHLGAWGKRGLWSMGCGWDTLHIIDHIGVSDKSENLIFGKNWKINDFEHLNERSSI